MVLTLFKAATKTGERRRNRVWDSDLSHDQAGFTLVEVLVACACAAIFSLIFATLLNSQSMGMLSTRIANVRDSLRASLERYIGIPAFMATSAAYTGAGSQGNILLNYCLNGGSGCGSANCCIDNHQGVTPALPAVTGQPFIFINPANGKPMTGTDAYTNANAAYSTPKGPVNYDQNGAVCTPGGASCPIEAITTFYATCPGGVPVGTTCAQASQIVVYYQIRMSTDNTGTAGSVAVLPNPGAPIPPVSGIFQPTSDSLIPGINGCTNSANCIQGYLPLFSASGGTSLTDSDVSESAAGQIGVGLPPGATPTHEFEVQSTPNPVTGVGYGLHTAEFYLNTAGPPSNNVGVAIGGIQSGPAAPVVSSIQGVNSGATPIFTNLSINDGGGFVGIGTSTPAYSLEVDTGAATTVAYFQNSSGSCTINPTGGGGVSGVSCSSDRRLKRDITTIDDALEKVEQLRGVSFLWKDSPHEGKRSLGLIAQEVEKVLPELVSEDKKGMKAVNYANLVAVLTNAIQELYAKVITFTSRLAHLDTQLTAVTARVSALETSPLRAPASGNGGAPPDPATLKSEIAELRTENGSLRTQLLAVKEWACAQKPAPSFCP